LLPGETSRFPSTLGPSVPQIVERPLKAASHVVARSVPRLCHRSGRCQASASRPANEIEIVVQLYAERLKLTGESLDKAPIDGLIGKGLPLNEDSPFADRSEVRNSDVSPLRARAHVDELGPRLRVKAVPRRSDVNLVDRTIGALIAQRTLPLSIPSNFKKKWNVTHYMWWLLGTSTQAHPRYALTNYNFPTTLTIETRQLCPGYNQVPHAQLLGGEQPRSDGWTIHTGHGLIKRARRANISGI